MKIFFGLHNPQIIFQHEAFQTLDPVVENQNLFAVLLALSCTENAEAG